MLTGAVGITKQITMHARCIAY